MSRILDSQGCPIPLIGDGIGEGIAVKVDSAGAILLGDSNGNEILQLRDGKVELAPGLEASEAAKMLLDGLGTLITMARDTGYTEGYHQAVRDREGE